MDLCRQTIQAELTRRNVSIPRQIRDRYAPKLSFIRWVQKVKPRYVWYKHCLKLAEVLQRVADGEITRLMVFMPPRHGKSEEVSRLFAAYYLYLYPERFVGLNSYSASLAFKLSLAARDHFVLGGGLLSRYANAVDHWETTDGGGLWAAGVGGSITGKGFHLGIVDDPIKNAAEARSETIRENIKEWWQSTFYTREEPGGAIVVIQTRWNEDDLSGWLLSEEHEDEEPERWHVVNYEAIKEDPRRVADPVTGEIAEQVRFPVTCSVERDWRATGEALCPERYPLVKLHKLLRAVGEYFWAALYQQRPSPREGSMFKRENFPIVGALPLGCQFVRWWDNAGSEKKGDYTAGVLITKAPDGRFFIVDVVRGQWTGATRDAIKLQTAYIDRIKYGHVQIWNETEGGSAGKDVSAATIKLLAGFSVQCEHSTGSKEVRAEPLASQVSVKNVALLQGAWNVAFINELIAFPNGKNDDQVDAAAAGFNKVTTPFDPKDLTIQMSAQGTGWKAAA